MAIKYIYNIFDDINAHNEDIINVNNQNAYETSFNLMLKENIISLEYNITPEKE